MTNGKAVVFGAAVVACLASAWADSIRVEARRGRRSCGEETVFRVSLLDDKGALRTSGEGVVTMDDFGFRTNFSERVDFAKGNPRLYRGTLAKPGFLRLTVDVKDANRDSDDKPYMFSVPYEHDRIGQGAPEPRDFDAFWRETLAEQEKIPADVRMREEPARSGEKWTMYRVSFATIGRRVYGWLSIPKGKGPWPAQVEIPGAGCGRYSMLMDGSADTVKMLLSVFPFEPSLDMKENEKSFEALNAGYRKRYGVPRYPFAGLDVSREEYFYRPVFAGAVRAVRWLASRPEVDPTRFTYRGTSQGGGSGLALLALASDVFTGGWVNVPALTDQLAMSQGRLGGWPHPEQEWSVPDAAARDARIRTVAPYYDGCNFAARVKCPVTVVAGLGDWVCPPACVCAAANRMPAEFRRLILAYGGSHWTAPRIAAEDAKKEDRAYTATRAEGAQRPGADGALIAPEDADYVRRKFREDVTEPGSGLGIEELTEGSYQLAHKVFAAEGNWQLAKAEAFAWICTNMSVSASEHDIFPAIACYSRWPRPLQKAVNWRNNDVDKRCLPNERSKVKQGWNSGRFSMWKDFDHSVPPWDELFAGGWPMMAARLDRYDRGTPYYRALRITLDGCLRALERFAAAARAAADKASTPEKRARLVREAEAFEHIRRAPPATAYEALAFQWSLFFLSEHVDNLQVRSLGALDILYTPLYRADLKAGRTTPEAFRRDLAHFWWQWGSVDNYWGQPVALGGTKADGTTEYNEVSDLILDVHDALGLPTPKMIVKIAPNTPDRYLDRMLGMAARNRSITFDGEEGIARSLKGWRGCTDEECRTADLNGCYEFYVHGSQNITQSSHISFLQPVADILARAKDGTFAAADYETFFAGYLAELKRNTLECCELTDAWERYLGDINPGNVYSLTVESAVRDGKDAFFNGLRYNDTALLSVGLGTTVDALLAVKEIVYEGGEGVKGCEGERIGLKELGEIMAKNWAGHEELRQRMLRSKRKWGNNDPEANRTGAEIVRNISSWVNGRTNARGGIWGFSGHPARQFIVLMAHTGATPDGRLAGEESSKNLSPTMGADTEGVTALVNTLSHLRPEDLPVNLPLDVQLHPSAAQGKEGLAAMRALARVYFANGGETLQFNVLDFAKLRDAQRHPWRYENLQVRVCGWNVRWNDLSREEQDKYILRAEKAVW